VWRIVGWCVMPRGLVQFVVWFVLAFLLVRGLIDVLGL